MSKFVVPEATIQTARYEIAHEKYVKCKEEDCCTEEELREVLPIDLPDLQTLVFQV